MGEEMAVVLVPCSEDVAEVMEAPEGKATVVAAGAAVAAVGARAAAAAAEARVAATAVAVVAGREEGG